MTTPTDTVRPDCDTCGWKKVYVDESVISGFKGYICKNDDCGAD